MEDLQSSLLVASEHYDKGQIKDAFQLFLSTAQHTIQPLFDVKFIHSSIVSRPKNSDLLLSTLHTCVDYIEKIMDQSVKYPPPLPPKPVHVSKPVLPPKPKRTTSLPANPLSNKQDQFNIDLNEQPKANVPDGEVDPLELVPAQTSNNESLISTNSDHIPNIPIPPLLKTHSVLQIKLDELESALKDFRNQRQKVESSHQQQLLDQAIDKYTPYIAEAKLTLNRVRTIYMSAATIPSILHFHPGQVAYQLTRIDSAIFLAIPSQALLSHTPKTPHPRIVASSDFFNYITRIIEHSVLLPQDASVRAQHINHWIKIASKCHELNNYQTLKAIISALGTPPVQRLKRTWAYIPKKSLARLDTMTELMSESNNYEKYREHLGLVSTSVLNGKSVHLIQTEHFKRPTVPFLGTFIHDLTYLLAANKSLDVEHLLILLQKFQAVPRYERNAIIDKIVNTNKIQKPALSQAIYRGTKTSIGKLGGAIGLGNNTDNATQTNDLTLDDFDNEEQQNLVMQYLLMRSWVNQSTVDELSILREPPNLKYTNSRTTSSNNSSSIMSNTSSFMRFSNPAITNSSLTLASSFDSVSRPTSLDDFSHDHVLIREDSFWNDASSLYDNSKVKAPIIPPRPNLVTK